MNLKVLRYFLEIAKTENISKAADNLYITQPALSRHIMELENELGVKLFTRDKRRLQLTEEGALLVKRSEEILFLVNKTAEEFSSSKDIISGSVYIGGGETSAMRLIFQAAKKVKDEHPDISFNIFSGDYSDVKAYLDKGLIDFGIFVEPANLTEYETIELPIKDTWGLITRSDSPLAAKKTVTPEDLRNTPLIVSRQVFSIDKNMEKYIGKPYGELNIVATYNLIYNASIMVDEGLGAALCIDKLINTFDNNSLIFRPLEPKYETALTLAYKKYKFFSKASSVFLKRFKEITAEYKNR